HAMKQCVVGVLGVQMGWVGITRYRGERLDIRPV
ncbi:MAG: hypothetical protein RJB64_56, partial [Pseudomonadota bacterium]